ncbi:hypothetical protein CERSUDRAFT_94627 [Gelatoporia subvermispora B]|uniref:Uncharacterized protein n=1 Tax=Ceriporiopsis subvermispora (strain B) TaxID=914234 RepID=M2QZI7_CERS8|nr:hypothetical protein CERSUDRAFT_94627 [Gelatoporia subvermispora B]
MPSKGASGKRAGEALEGNASNKPRKMHPKTVDRVIKDMFDFSERMAKLEIDTLKAKRNADKEAQELRKLDLQYAEKLLELARARENTKGLYDPLLESGSCGSLTNSGSSMSGSLSGTTLHCSPSQMFLTDRIHSPTADSILTCAMDIGCMGEAAAPTFDYLGNTITAGDGIRGTPASMTFHYDQDVTGGLCDAVGTSDGGSYGSLQTSAFGSYASMHSALRSDGSMHASAVASGKSLQTSAIAPYGGVNASSAVSSDSAHSADAVISGAGSAMSAPKDIMDQGRTTAVPDAAVESYTVTTSAAGKKATLKWMEIVNNGSVSANDGGGSGNGEEHLESAKKPERQTTMLGLFSSWEDDDDGFDAAGALAGSGADIWSN